MGSSTMTPGNWPRILQDVSAIPSEDTHSLSRIDAIWDLIQNDTGADKAALSANDRQAPSCAPHARFPQKRAVAAIDTRVSS